MPGTGIGISPLLNRKPHGGSPYGNLYTENFNPISGTLDPFGPVSYTFTPGNAALSGGNGTFNAGLTFLNIVWNGNNWYLKSKFSYTSTNHNDPGCNFGLNSANGISGSKFSVYFGPYFFDANNQSKVVIWGYNFLNGPIANSPGFVTINVGDIIQLEATFVESVFTVTVTNLTVPSTQTASYNYSYVFGLSDPVNMTKPNTGRLNIFPPANTVNVTEVIFGTNYLSKVDLLVQGDSLSAGYCQQSEAQRWIDQYSNAKHKTFALFAGAGDRARECENVIALGLYSKIKPKKIILFFGTNDLGSGDSPANIANYLQQGGDFWASQGILSSNIYIAELFPRNDIDVRPTNTFIHTTVTYPIIDWYHILEDPGNPGNMNPLYVVGDGVHINALGATQISNYLVSLNI